MINFLDSNIVENVQKGVAEKIKSTYQLATDLESIACIFSKHVRHCMESLPAKIIQLISKQNERGQLSIASILQDKKIHSAISTLKMQVEDENSWINFFKLFEQLISSSHECLTIVKENYASCSMIFCPNFSLMILKIVSTISTISCLLIADKELILVSN